MNRCTRNLVALYDAATEADLVLGRDWYAEAHRIALLVGKGDANMGAGILAALSPQTSWKENVKRALAATRTKRGNFRGGHTGACLGKAERIYRGFHPLDVLKGSKERAFYIGILTSGATQEVCIDRHAIGACLGRPATDAERSLTNRTMQGRKDYAEYSDAYREAASILPYTAAQLQAIVWVVWRRQNNVNT